MQAEEKRRDDSEVAAAAAHGPVEVLIFLGAGGDEAAVGEHHVHGQKIIDGQAVGAAQVADSAAQRQARDAGGGNRAGRRGHAEGVRGVIHIAARASALGPRRARRRFDPHASHQGKVNDQAAIADPESAGVVPAAANRHQNILLASGVHGGDHICHVHTARDGSRPLVDHAVVNFPGCIIAPVRRSENLTPELRFQLIDGFLHRHSFPPL